MHLNVFNYIYHNNINIINYFYVTVLFNFHIEQLKNKFN